MRKLVSAIRAIPKGLPRRAVVVDDWYGDKSVEFVEIVRNKINHEE